MSIFFFSHLLYGVALIVLYYPCYHPVDESYCVFLEYGSQTGICRGEKCFLCPGSILLMSSKGIFDLVSHIILLSPWVTVTTSTSFCPSAFGLLGHLRGRKRKECFHVKILMCMNFHTERYWEWNLLPRWRQCFPGENWTIWHFCGITLTDQ